MLRATKKETIFSKKCITDTNHPERIYLCSYCNLLFEGHDVVGVYTSPDGDEFTRCANPKGWIGSGVCDAPMSWGTREYFESKYDLKPVD